MRNMHKQTTLFNLEIQTKKLIWKKRRRVVPLKSILYIFIWIYTMIYQWYGHIIPHIFMWIYITMCQCMYIQYAQAEDIVSLGTSDDENGEGDLQITTKLASTEKTNTCLLQRLASKVEVAVCCSVLQCVAVCCSVLQCVAVCCSVLQCVATRCSVLQCVLMCCRDE